MPSSYGPSIAKVFTNDVDVRNLRERLEDEGKVPICHFNKVLGYRFTDIEVSPSAKAELVKALKLVEWYNTLLCRLEPRAADDLKEMLRGRS